MKNMKKEYAKNMSFRLLAEEWLCQGGAIGEGCAVTGLTTLPASWLTNGKAEAWIFLICEEGNATVEIDDKRETFQSGRMLVLAPKARIRIWCEARCVVRGLAAEDGFFARQHYHLSDTLLTKDRLGKGALLRLTEVEQEAFARQLEALRAVLLLSTRHIPFLEQAMKAAVGTFYYLACGRLIEGEQAYEATDARSRPEEHFFRFIGLLARHGQMERSVAFYAKQMYISRSHLSTLVIEVSGRKATEWIRDFVVREAGRMLHDTSMSMKEIASELGFSSASSFGKYFKQGSSLSPARFRAQACERTVKPSAP